MGAAVELLIDLSGRSLKVGRRSIAVVVSKVGFIHIRSTGRTVIVTLQPELLSQLTLAAAGYEIGDLNPERTVVVAGIASPKCWVFAGYMPALRKIASLGRGTGDPDAYGLAEAIEYLV